LIPLALAAGIAAGDFFLANRANEKLISETAADRRWLLAAVLAALALFLAHLLVDAARAQFAADPARRSALLSLWGAVRLFGRRPLRMLSIGALGALLAAVPAAILMASRLRIEQRNALLVAAAWLLAQAAQLSVGWGRNVRLFAFAELIRADAAWHARPQAAVLRTPTSVPPLEPASLPPADPAAAEEVAPLSKGQGPAI
jgi:hypothetical protein